MEIFGISTLLVDDKLCVKQNKISQEIISLSIIIGFYITSSSVLIKPLLAEKWFCVAILEAQMRALAFLTFWYIQIQKY